MIHNDRIQFKYNANGIAVLGTRTHSLSTTQEEAC
jgi:hypothetical protein